MNTKMPLVTRSRRNPDCRSHCSVQKGRSLSRVTEGRTQRLEAARHGCIELWNFTELEVQISVHCRTWWGKGRGESKNHSKVDIVVGVLVAVELKFRSDCGVGVLS